MYTAIYSLLESFFGFSPYLKVFTYCYFMPCSSDPVYYISALSFVLISTLIVFLVSFVVLTIMEKVKINKYKKH